MITVLTTYFNQPEMLQRHLAEWDKYKDQAKFIIVDDNSTEALNIDFPNLSIYRILNDIIWNQTGARNLGHVVAETPWIVSTDLDHVVTEECFRMVNALSKVNDRKVYFLARDFTHGLRKAYRMHSSFFINRDAYISVGGHDEDLAGSYGCVDASWARICNERLEYEWRKDIRVLNYSNHPGISDANVKLNRDSARNKKILLEKAKQGLPRGKMCRFEWEKII